MKIWNCLHIAALFSVILWLSACGKEDIAVANVVKELDFEIPAGLSTIETHTFFFPSFVFGIEEILAQQGVDAADIDRISSRQGFITARFDNIDWDFVSRVTIEAVKLDGTGERTELFYMDPVPFNVNEQIELFPSLPNLKDILLDEFVNLEVKMRFRNFSPTNIDTRLRLEFAIFDEE